MMKKILSLLLTILLLLSSMLFVPACTDRDSAQDGTQSNTSEEPTAPPIQDYDKPTSAPLEIVKDGVAQYTLVTPKNASAAVMSARTTLVRAIQELTGVSLYRIDDEEAAKTSGNYILLGTTCFDESATVIESLAKNEEAFAVKRLGEHIVFATHFDCDITKAVEQYVATLLAEQYDKSTKTLTLTEHRSNGAEALPTTFDVSKIASYKIVYSKQLDGYYEIAQQIQEQLLRAAGVKLPVVLDTATVETSQEILIGETTRHLSRKCYKNGAALMEYKAVVEKGQLQLVCGGPYSAKLGGIALADAIRKDRKMVLPAGTHMEKQLATETIPHTEGTDIRIMSANILSESAITNPDKHPPSYERAEIFAKILVDYTPDLVGVQEMDGGFHAPMEHYFKVIKKVYGIEYTMLLSTYQSKVNHSPIIYRSDKYKLDLQKFTPMSYTSSAVKEYSSGISSAKFTSLAEPSIEVALLSAHWHWEAEYASSTPKQYCDAVEMAAVVKELQTAYPNTRVFCTGDFNSHRYSGAYFNQFINSINGAVASKIADANGVLIPSFKHQNQYIDHIVGTAGSFDVLLHRGATNSYQTLTDHQPIFADIKFQ